MAAFESTWPPAATRRLGRWTLRDGQGGGKRVSAATAGPEPEGALTPADWVGALPAAETAMRALCQPPLFRLDPEQTALDAALAARGYRVADPTVIYAAPTARIATERPPPVTTFEVWEPLAIMREIWADGGIGPARLAVMDRATAPKTALLGRRADQPAAAAFAAAHRGVAMVHALEVRPDHRGHGLGRWMMRAAAFWALAQGAGQLAVAVTRQNTAGNALYASLGMAVVGSYHYRIKEDV